MRCDSPEFSSRLPAPARSIGLLALVAAAAAAFVSACDTRLNSKVSARPRTFKLESVVPASGSETVSPDQVIELRFSSPLDRSSLGDNLSELPSLIELVRRDTGARARALYELDTFDQRVVIRPETRWAAPAVIYEIHISGQLLDVDQRELSLSSFAQPIVFTTVPDTTPPNFAGIRELFPICSALVATWDAAQDDVTPPDRLRYRVYLSPPPANFPAAGFLEVEGLTQRLLSGLVSGIFYTVRVTAVDGAGNETVGDPNLSARAELADLEPPIFAGALSLIPEGAPAFSATSLRVLWDPAADNCDTASVRYRVYLAVCSASIGDCPNTVSRDECLANAALCRVPVTSCDTVEERCALDAEECAVVNASCSFTADEVLARASRVVTTSPGSTEILFENLRSDTRYAAVVRAIDTADNQDDNTVVVEASTRTSFSREVGEVLASAGCTLDFCHSRGSRSGCLNLEDYQDLIDKTRGCVPNPANPRTIQPGDPDRSDLVLRIETDNLAIRMPPCWDARLPLCPKQIEVLRRWIEQGAHDN